ncbi:MAG: twitching motility protein PilT [Methanobacteriota archaeon]|nr:MAG: twitching motility protein PilT [Euryarchaeota archaeon]
MPRLVLLDANALLMPFQFQVHLEAELHRVLGDVEIAVPSPVLSELTRMADDNRDARAAARLAKKYRAIEGHGSADDALLELAVAHRAVVVTNDQPLLDRLKSAGIPRVFLRSRNHLVAEGV